MDKDPTLGRAALVMAYAIVSYGLIVAVAWSVPKELGTWAVAGLAAVCLVGALAMGIMRK